MLDAYSIALTNAVRRVSLDVAAGDSDSKLLQESLSLEIGRQERLTKIKDKRVQLELPDTLEGRTKALENLDNG